MMKAIATISIVVETFPAVALVVGLIRAITMQNLSLVTKEAISFSKPRFDHMVEVLGSCELLGFEMCATLEKVMKPAPSCFLDFCLLAQRCLW